MKTKLITLADEIIAKKIKPEDMQSMVKFAKTKNMCLSSVQLKDGTSAKILVSPDEIDCLIMKNGKVITAKGIKDNPVNVMGIAGKIFDHIIQRGRAVNPKEAKDNSFKIISDFFEKFENEVKEYFS